MINEKPSYLQSLDNFVHDQLLVDNNKSVYRKGSLALKTNALSNTFVSTRALLTEKLFNSLAQAFVKHYPSLQWDINAYGEQFAEFILSQTKSSKTDVNWTLAAELASLEYLVCVLYYYEEDMVAEFSSNQIKQLAPLLFEHHPYLDIQLDKSSSDRKIARIKHQGLYRIYLS